MATVRLFAHARDAAGVSRDTIEAATLGELLDTAVATYGPAFAEVLQRCTVWVNGAEPEGGRAATLAAGDEVAILPPVSGGARRER